MRGAVLYAPGDVRVEDRQDPAIIEPTDAVIRLTATCVCGSDLWPYRGVEQVDGPAPMGHEYVGVVEEVGSQVTTVRPGQFVVGSFWASDNTCEICRAGYQSGCVNRVLMGALGTQSQFARIPLADGTLVATPGLPDADLVPSLLAASDVLGTGWFAAVAAERGDDGVAAVKELTNGLGAHSVVEAVGTQQSMMQAIRSTRPGGHVGVSHDVAPSRSSCSPDPVTRACAPPWTPGSVTTDADGVVGITPRWWTAAGLPGRRPRASVRPRTPPGSGSCRSAPGGPGRGPAPSCTCPRPRTAAGRRSRTPG
ncbi:alcohol dehydrogenase catalytic domain-containing protein [Nonomuraea sp. NPDC023979]|uniref:alcohol dehydrogenase catalytic domain-containing protein n=1 Tax=Nonomuraea sp. NPDC023979 TaxID=3154796 RepID=UPI0033E6E8A5